MCVTTAYCLKYAEDNWPRAGVSKGHIKSFWLMPKSDFELQKSIRDWHLKVSWYHTSYKDICLERETVSTHVLRALLSRDTAWITESLPRHRLCLHYDCGSWEKLQNTHLSGVPCLMTSIKPGKTEKKRPKKKKKIASGRLKQASQQFIIAILITTKFSLSVCRLFTHTQL